MSIIARELAKLKTEALNLAKRISLLEGVAHEGVEEARTAEEQKVILIDELASILKVSTNTARRWLHEGRLNPHYRRGRTYYWLRDDLDQILRNNENGKK